MNRKINKILKMKNNRQKSAIGLESSQKKIMIHGKKLMNSEQNYKYE